MDVRPFESADEPAIVRLWADCGLVVPWNDPARDIRRKLAVQPELLLVGTENGRIVATVMAGYDGHRGWINYLAVHPDKRRRGIGARVMAEAERLLRDRGCAKINLQVRTSNREVIAFYERLGFKTDDIVSMGKRLESDDRRRADDRG
ncbi:MAG: GNAT family acetyltransferase [Chitinivibrionales bacterium]|nr:GNAT family acetyltransferase [Chitinivibrionales bacterium]